MDGQSFNVVTGADPARAPGTTAALAAARPTCAEVQRACIIAQAVVAIAAGQTGSSDARPETVARPARAATFARQMAMYLAHVGFGVSMAEIGRAFGRDRTTVVHACHLIEDRRDAARFDELLDHLEQAAVALRAATRLNPRG